MLGRRMFDWPSKGRLNPALEMERLSRDISQLSSAVLGRPGLWFLPSHVFPAVNITEDKEKYYVRAELPGMRAEEISVEVDGKNLAISGERKISFEGQNARYHRREREAGKFSRGIALPGEINADHIDAKMVNGILTVALEKSTTSKPKQIRVN
jgi:HSP20 family protein